MPESANADQQADPRDTAARRPPAAANVSSASGAAFVVWVDENVIDGGYTAYSGFAPGLTAHGRTVAEALTNFADGYANREDAR